MSLRAAFPFKISLQCFFFFKKKKHYQNVISSSFQGLPKYSLFYIYRYPTAAIFKEGFEPPTLTSLTPSSSTLTPDYPIVAKQRPKISTQKVVVLFADENEQTHKRGYILYPQTDVVLNEAEVY